MARPASVGCGTARQWCQQRMAAGSASPGGRRSNLGQVLPRSSGNRLVHRVGWWVTRRATVAISTPRSTTSICPRFSCRMYRPCPHPLALPVDLRRTGLAGIRHTGAVALGRVACKRNTTFRRLRYRWERRGRGSPACQKSPVITGVLPGTACHRQVLAPAASRCCHPMKLRLTSAVILLAPERRPWRRRTPAPRVISRACAPVSAGVPAGS